MADPITKLRALVEAEASYDRLQRELLTEKIPGLPDVYSAQSCERWLAGYDYALAHPPQYAARLAVLFADGSLISEPTEADTLKAFHAADFDEPPTLVWIAANPTPVPPEAVV